MAVEERRVLCGVEDEEVGGLCRCVVDCKVAVCKSLADERRSC